MYTLDQAEQLAAEFLRKTSAGWDSEVALFGEDELKARKGEFYYFAWQGAKYIATRDDKYFLYGTTHISVHGETGDCRFLSIHECHSVDPFNQRTN
ncbi:hypothetical protein OG588_17365 [Streptomyces prunicolor]|uniref:hypothetical protein n=1 Tax=Streptomyces prunicolor TaxID=67348 RepID=UPI003865A7C1|nr:hypothetical protein OG588_17365 [Streptomyces prunicolor]